MGEQLRVRRITAYCLLAVCAATVALIVADIASPVRTVVILLFTGTVPGWSLISYVNVRHSSVTWISAVGLSLSISIVVAQVLVLAKVWYPKAAVVVLACTMVPMLVHHIVRSRLVEQPPANREPPDPGPLARPDPSAGTP